MFLLRFRKRKAKDDRAVAIPWESGPLALLLEGIRFCELRNAVKSRCALPESHLRRRLHMWPCLLHPDGATPGKAQTCFGIHQGPRPTPIAASDLLIPRFILLLTLRRIERDHSMFASFRCFGRAAGLKECQECVIREVSDARAAPILRANRGPYAEKGRGRFIPAL